MNNRREGLLGEDTASKYLEERGYKILERNYVAKHGEIDIIAFKERTVIFVEVKSRQNVKYGLPVEAVDRKKQCAIISASLEFIRKKKYYDYNIRYDVIAVLRDSVEHIDNAFDADSAGYAKKYLV